MKIDIIECNSPISVHTFARTETHVDQIPMEVEMYDPSVTKTSTESSHPVPKQKTSSKGKKRNIVKHGGIEKYLLRQSRPRSSTSSESALVRKDPKPSNSLPCQMHH